MCETILSVPVLMKKVLDWKPLAWGEDNWVAAIKKDKIKIRIGEKNPEYSHPQWERFSKFRYKKCQLKPCSMRNREKLLCPKIAGHILTTSTCVLK